MTTSYDASISQKNGHSAHCDDLSTLNTHAPPPPPPAVGEWAQAVNGGSFQRLLITSSNRENGVATIDSTTKQDPYTSFQKPTFLELPPGEGVVLSNGVLTVGLSSLEQVHADGCTTPHRPMLKAVNKRAGVIVYFRPRCKMWSCPACAKTNSDMWIMRVVNATQQYQAGGLECCFVTITSHERLNAKRSLDVMPHAWKNLSMRWRRKVGSKPYVVIPERHKDGRVHIHGIFMSAVGTQWWKDNARQCGMGWRNEEGTIQSPYYAGFYVGKYLSKQLATHKYKKGFRRVRTSFGYPKQATLPRSENWTFEPLPTGDSVQDDAQFFQQKGYSVAVADHRSAWTIVNAYDSFSEKSATL